jgi:hypothetical protein
MKNYKTKFAGVVWSSEIAGHCIKSNNNYTKKHNFINKIKI